MKHWRLFALAFCGLLTIPLIGQAQVPVVGPQTYTFTAGSQSNVWTCNGGQSSFALSVPTGLTGTFTVTVGQAMGSATSNPPWSYAPGAAAYTNTIVNSGSLTVNLGSNLYVKVADTSYSSGSVTVTGVCSGAVAVVPPQIVSVTGSGNIAVSTGPTPNVTITNAPTFTGAVSAGSATGATLTAGDLGASRSVSSGALNLGGSTTSCLLDFGVTTAAVETLACPFTTTGALKATSATLSTPLSVANGGTGLGTQADNSCVGTTGTGTVSTSGACQTVFNVESPAFGAVCNGTNDDGPAIQLAINAAEVLQAPSHVLLPGTCATSQTLVITGNNVHIEGYGSISLKQVSLAKSSLLWTGSSGGTMIQFAPSSGACAECVIDRGGVSHLTLLSNNGTAAVGIDLQGMSGGTFHDLYADNFTMAAYLIDGSPYATSFASNHNDWKNLGWNDTTNSGYMFWEKNSFEERVSNVFADNDTQAIFFLGGGPSGTAGQTSDADLFTQIHGTSIGTNFAFDMSCGSYGNTVNHVTGEIFVRGTATCTGALPASYANIVTDFDHCDDPVPYPTIEAGAVLTYTTNCGDLRLSGAFTNPGYSQHGFVTVTTPASCASLAACGTASVTFTTTMTASPTCVASAVIAASGPYAVTINAKSQSGATFGLYALAATSASQSVPVDYDCKV